MANENELFSAGLDDREVRAALSGLNNAIQQLAAASEAAFGRADKQVKELGRSTGETTKNFSLMKTAIVAVGNIAANIFMDLINQIKQLIASTGEYIKQSVDLSRMVEMQTNILVKLGNSHGYARKEMMGFVEGLKEQGITTRASVNTLNQMVQSNLDLTKAVELAEAAQNRGRIANLNSSETMERLIWGIGKLDTQIFRTAGFLIQSEQAYDKYARSIGKASGAALTFTEKQKALTDALIEFGKSGAGAYEAAAETIGGQLKSYPRYLEEIQLAMGQAFQPFFDVFTTEKIMLVKQLSIFFEENAETVEDFGIALGVAGEHLLGLVTSIGSLITVLPDLVEGLIIVEGKLLGIDEEAEKMPARVGKALAEVVTLVSAAAAGGISLVAGSFDIIVKSVKDIKSLLKKELTTDELAEKWRGYGEEWEASIAEAMTEAVNTVGDLTGAVDDLGDGLDDLDEDVRDVKQTFGEFMDTVRELDQSLLQLKVRLGRQFIDLEIRRSRETIDIARRESRYREDIARNTARSLEDIARGEREAKERLLKNASEAEQQFEKDVTDERKAIEKDRQKQLIDLERTFRRTLLDIQRDFERSAREAAIRNDAIAFLQAKRGRDDRISDAKMDRSRTQGDINRTADEQRKDFENNLAEERAKLKDDLAERLKAVEEAAAKQRESLKRGLARQAEDHKISLDRQAEDRAIADERREEDLRRSLGRQIEDLKVKHGEQVDITVDALLEESKAYTATYGPGGSVDVIMNDFFKRRQEYARQMQYYKEVTSPGTPSSIARLGSIPGYGSTPRSARRRGQSGLITDILTEGTSRMVDMPQNVQSPAAPLGRGAGGGTQDLTFNFHGVEPYLQRVATQAAIEVYRSVMTT